MYFLCCGALKWTIAASLNAAAPSPQFSPFAFFVDCDACFRLLARALGFHRVGSLDCARAGFCVMAIMEPCGSGSAVGQARFEIKS